MTDPDATDAAGPAPRGPALIVISPEGEAGGTVRLAADRSA